MPGIPTLFDEERLLAAIKNEKLEVLNLSAAYVEDKKTEIKTTATLSHTAMIYALTVLPDGRLASSGSADGTICLWDVESGTCVATLTTLSEDLNTARILTALPDGRLASGHDDKSIHLWDVKSEACVATLNKYTQDANMPRFPGGISALTALPDGRLASGSEYSDKTISLWDVESGTCVATLKGHKRSVKALTVLPDGRLASGSTDGTTRLWDVKSGTCVATLRGHSTVYALAVLPDGRLASGYDGGIIRLWDVKSETCVATLSERNTGNISALAVLLDGRLASASFNNTICLWDIESETCVATLYGHTQSIYALTALPDGRLASGSWDCTLRLWDVGLRPTSALALQRVLASLETNTSVREVNLQHTAFNDASLASLTDIFKSNYTVTTLDVTYTQVTADGAKAFYNALPADHPLRQGFRHEAAFHLYCKDALEKYIYPADLLNIVTSYIPPEETLPPRVSPAGRSSFFRPVPPEVLTETEATDSSDPTIAIRGSQKSCVIS